MIDEGNAFPQALIIIYMNPNLKYPRPTNGVRNHFEIMEHLKIS